MLEFNNPERAKDLRTLLTFAMLSQLLQTKILVGQPKCQPILVSPGSVLSDGIVSIT